MLMGWWLILNEELKRVCTRCLEQGTWRSPFVLNDNEDQKQIVGFERLCSNEHIMLLHTETVIWTCSNEHYVGSNEQADQLALDVVLLTFCILELIIMPFILSFKYVRLINIFSSINRELICSFGIIKHKP